MKNIKKLNNNLDISTFSPFKFTEGWLSGFIQSDGSFTITFEKRTTGLLIRPKPIFVLTQDISEEKLFKSLHTYLGAGYITKNKNNVSLNITSLSDLKDILFPILDSHPLKYGKLTAYLIFKNIVEEMLNKNHLNLEGLLRIIYTSFELNKETGRRTEESKINLQKFLENKHGKLPKVELLSSALGEPLSEVLIEESVLPLPTRPNISLEFIAGLIDGDGSFNVSFQIKPYRRVRVNFTVVQETSCRELLYDLRSYFSCGNVYDLPSKASSKTSKYIIDDISLILNTLVPILNKVNFNSSKSQDYEIMIKVCEALRLKSLKGLSDEIFISIIELAYKKNKLENKGRISKEEFIQKVKNISSKKEVVSGKSQGATPLKGVAPLSVSNPQGVLSVERAPIAKGININSIQKRRLTTSSLYDTKLNPNFVSGFVDGEGSFYIVMSRDKTRSTGWNITPGFSIQLHGRDLVLLKQIQSFFGAGRISFDAKRKAVAYNVTDLKGLINNIIPHFEKYPLITKKRGDYILFKSGLELIEKKEHLSLEGCRKIVEIKACMNKGLRDVVKDFFPDIIPVERPEVDLSTIDANWLAGFTSGEGYFGVTVYKSSTSKLGKSVLLKFQLTQHERDKELLSLIVKYLNCGSLQTSRTAKDLQVTKFKDIYSTIIPFFVKHPILGVKARDFDDFIKVAELIKEKAHLTKEGLELILEISSSMNTGREINA